MDVIVGSKPNTDRIAVAKELVESSSQGRGRLLQVKLCIAVSITYYALFRNICKNFADCTVGTF